MMVIKRNKLWLISEQAEVTFRPFNCLSIQFHFQEE